MTKKEDIRKRKTKKRLETALMTLLKKKDLHEVKIKELTEMAGISRITFYRHYEIIEELFEDCVQSLFAKMEGERIEVMENTSRDPSNMILEMFRLFYRYKEDLGIILSIDNKDLVIENIHKQYKISYKYFGVLEYSPPDESSFQYLYIKYESAGLYIILKEWLTKKKDLTPEQLAEIYLKIRRKPYY